MNVEHTVNCAEGEEEKEYLEIETVENDLSCDECGENLCLPNPTNKERNLALVEFILNSRFVDDQ